MSTCVVICEGQTEAQFLKSVVSPYLANKQVNLQLEARIISTGKNERGGLAKGGGLSLAKTQIFVCNTFYEVPTAITTFFDLYALGSTFPGHAEIQARISIGHRLSGVEKAEIHERHLANYISQNGCSSYQTKFQPYVQPYEIESLLFASPDHIKTYRPEWSTTKLGITERYELEDIEPEEINDGVTTHPSARLGRLIPIYKKTSDGPAIANSIGIDAIRSKCSHFNDWVTWLETV